MSVDEREIGDTSGEPENQEQDLAAAEPVAPGTDSVGFAVALASLLSKYPRKWLAILGMVSSGLAALVGILLPLL